MGFFEVFAAVLAFFYGLIQSYGLAIILLTVTVRVVLLPLSIKQTRSMREMQMIQPEIKRLQAKYKGNRQKMNEEMMALYKEHGVNPLGGCLPLLLQMPVLIGLFYVIRNPVEMAASGVLRLKYVEEGTRLGQDLLEKALQVNQFLGIRLDCTAQLAIQRDASEAVPNTTCGDGFVSAIPYLVMVLAMGFTTWYQQKQMMASRGAAQDATAQQMQTFAKIMPFMLMIFSFNFPSGVVLYWLTTNLWTILQQRIMLKAAPPIVPGTVKPKTVEANLVEKGSRGGSKTGNPKGSKGATKGKDAQAPAAKPTSKPHPSSKKKKRR
ncbi:MAG: YidC/Oxa1 family membrane protein insertase [Actinomycetota bacterium]